MKQLRGVILFTAIEIGALVLWLALARRGENVLSFVLLAGGLLSEHYVSLNVGANRKPFARLPD